MDHVPNTNLPKTMAVRRALQTGDKRAVADLLFLESWEAQPRPDIASTLRIHQIRRANPELAAAIRAELTAARTGVAIATLGRRLPTASF